MEPKFYEISGTKHNVWSLKIWLFDDLLWENNFLFACVCCQSSTINDNDDEWNGRTYWFTAYELTTNVVRHTQRQKKRTVLTYVSLNVPLNVYGRCERFRTDVYIVIVVTSKLKPAIDRYLTCLFCYSSLILPEILLLLAWILHLADSGIF